MCGPVPKTLLLTAKAAGRNPTVRLKSGFQVLELESEGGAGARTGRLEMDG
jgi:hypothetical protein